VPNPEDPGDLEFATAEPRRQAVGSLVDEQERSRENLDGEIPDWEQDPVDPADPSGHEASSEAPPTSGEPFVEDDLLEPEDSDFFEDEDDDPFEGGVEDPAEQQDDDFADPEEEPGDDRPIRPDAHDPSPEPEGPPEPDGSDRDGSDPDEEWEPVSLLDTVRSHPAVVVIVGGLAVLSLVAAMVFFVGRLSGHGSNSLSLPSDVGAPPATSVPSEPGPVRSASKSQARAATSPSTTAPATQDSPAVADPISGATTAPDSAPDTAGTASPAPASVSGAAPGTCSPGDVSITTTTDSASYNPGADVTVTSRLVDDAACVFTPVQSGQYSCPTTVLIVGGSGSQVYPMNGQKEDCADVPAETLEPGTAVTVTSMWPEQTMGSGGPGQARGGQYRAQAVWAWSAGSGAAPYQVAADSPPFSVAS
jgi:hypothetical protein